jgi:nucleoid-associated protein YgaU
MANESSKEVTPQKDGLALVVGGLFILALVFAAYNYFSKGTNVEDTSVTNDQSDQGVVVKKEQPEEEPSKQPETNQEGSINGEGAKDVKKDEAVAGTKIEETSKGTVTQTTWTASDYKSGDIKAGNYTVKSGDTLWEIAEGLYGNGAAWTKILDANKGSVGFLANGTQALIVPGQVLVLP